MEPTEVAKFADELKWCISQLEMGLQRQSPDSRQAQETMKILRILRSGKAPLIKKRQAMRNALGDYRKKMRDEEKMSLNAMKHSKFKSRDNMKVFKKSKFFRQSHRRQVVNEDSHQLNLQLDGLNLHQFASSPSTLAADSSDRALYNSATAEPLQNGHVFPLPCDPSDSLDPLRCNPDGPQKMTNTDTNDDALSFKFCPSGNSFSFNFDMNNGSNTADKENEADKSLNNDVAQNTENNLFKFAKSDNSFAFNFDS